MTIKAIQQATYRRFGYIRASNLCRNFGEILKSTPVGKYFGTQNTSAIIVGAGPSLGKALPYLKKFTGMIICMATSYRLLLRNEIVPHFVIAGDPQKDQGLHFKGCGNRSIITSPFVYPGAIRGQTNIMSSGVHPLFQLLEKYSTRYESLYSSGTAVSRGFDFAVKSGCKPVGLIGVDLVNLGDTHVKGVSNWRKDFHYNRYLTIETGWRIEESKRTRCAVKMNNGKMGNSNVIYEAYIKGMRAHFRGKKDIYSLAWYGADLAIPYMPIRKFVKYSGGEVRRIVSPAKVSLSALRAELEFVLSKMTGFNETSEIWLDPVMQEAIQNAYMYDDRSYIDKGLVRALALNKKLLSIVLDQFL